jgi:glyoxylase-like metal-dependent hydrolase (beta-lactamase superfamily II)
MSWFEVETRSDAIYRIREPALGDLDCCNCWLVLGARRALLIDSGVGVSPLAPVVAAITSLPTTLILTHTHYDHIGGAHEFAERIAHPAEAEALANPTPEATLHEGWLTPESFAYAPYPGFDVRDYAVRPAPATRLVEDGEVLDLGGRRIEVVHAPGHSPGLLCLFDRACGALFSSDALYDGPMFFDLPGSDPETAARTIERLCELAPRVVHPGHYASIAASELVNVAAQAREQAAVAARTPHEV